MAKYITIVSLWTVAPEIILEDQSKSKHHQTVSLKTKIIEIIIPWITIVSQRIIA